MQEERFGKSVSIGWPLWREGGMKVDEQVERMMKGVSGMVPLETSVGVEAFDYAFDDDRVWSCGGGRR